MNITLDSLPGMELILPAIVDSLDIKSICQLRYEIKLQCNPDLVTHLVCQKTVTKSRGVTK